MLLPFLTHRFLLLFQTKKCWGSIAVAENGRESKDEEV
jgi:hypothetical protein